MGKFACIKIHVLCMIGPLGYYECNFQGVHILQIFKRRELRKNMYSAKISTFTVSGRIVGEIDVWDWESGDHFFCFFEQFIQASYTICSYSRQEFNVIRKYICVHKRIQ